jgi:hypothetical protein
MFVLPFVERSVFQSEPCLRVTDVEQGVILVMLSQPLGTGIAGAWLCMLPVLFARYSTPSATHARLQREYSAIA